MALPEHLQKIVDSPKAQKAYKEAQYKSGVKHLGKEHTISSMKEKYSTAKSSALKSKMGQEVRTKRIAGQTNYIVGGHYFNDKAGAHHFAKTGKTLPGQHAR